MSPSDISTIFNKLKVKGVINGSKAIEYEDLLVTIFEFEGKDEAQDKLIMFLNTNGVSQAKIAQKLNVSARLVRNILSKNSELWQKNILYRMYLLGAKQIIS